MTKEELIEELEKLPEGTMVLTGEWINEVNGPIGWDNIDLIFTQGNAYIFGSGGSPFSSDK